MCIRCIRCIKSTSQAVFLMKTFYHFMFQLFLKKHVFDIMPFCQASRFREVYSTEFGFSVHLTVVSYIRKKGKVVVMININGG